MIKKNISVKNNLLKIMYLGIFLFLLNILTVSVSANYQSYIIPPQSEIILATQGGGTPVNLQVPIPGSSGGDKIMPNEEESGYLLPYVMMLYTWLAGIIGSIAVLMIIISGIQIILAGYDSSMLESAKKRIEGAVIGLLLLLTSAILLYTINPDAFQAF